MKVKGKNWPMLDCTYASTLFKIFGKSRSLFGKLRTPVEYKKGIRSKRQVKNRSIIWCYLINIKKAKNMEIYVFVAWKNNSTTILV
jgi:hypothetical protein